MTKQTEEDNTISANLPEDYMEVSIDFDAWADAISSTGELTVNTLAQYLRASFERDVPEEYVELVEHRAEKTH